MVAEYVAEVAVKEVIRLNMIFNVLAQKTEVPCKLYVIRCDNKSAIDFTRNKIERSHIKYRHSLSYY